LYGVEEKNGRKKELGVDDLWLENRCRRSLENVQNGNDVRVLLFLCASLPSTSRTCQKSVTDPEQSTAEQSEFALCGFMWRELQTLNMHLFTLASGLDQQALLSTPRRSFPRLEHGLMS